MKKIIVKWMWSTCYGDFEYGENTIDVPEEINMKDKVLEFFRSPDFTYNDAGTREPEKDADCLNFNAYQVLASGIAGAFLFSGTYACREIDWESREIPLDL